MKKVLLSLLTGALAGAVGVWIFLSRHDAGEEKEKKEEHKEESRVQHRTNGETFLKLDKEAQEHAGLKMAALEAAQLKPEIKAFGRVLDPAPLATALVDIATAGAQLEASLKEFERLKVLHGQNQNVSTRVLEAAEAAVKRDQIAREAAQVRLMATWGKSIAETKDLDQLVHGLVSQRVSLIRVDVPSGENLTGIPIGGRIIALSAPDRPLAVEFLGAAPSVDPQTQGRGFLFLLKTNTPAPNAAVTAWLSLPGEAESGALVPRGAVLRHDGEAFVYLQTGDEMFQRQQIQLEHPLDLGWFVSASELKPGAKIVVVGAQQLLSEEVKGEGGE